MNNMSLLSPVKQIKRSSYAMFILLSNQSNSLMEHHAWGDRKIPIRNLIVFINDKPSQEFQHVKILILQELVNYIEFFKPTFSNRETRQIYDFLLQKNERK